MLKFHIHTDFTVNKANHIFRSHFYKVFECKDSDIMFKL